MTGDEAANWQYKRVIALAKPEPGSFNGAKGAKL